MDIKNNVIPFDLNRKRNKAPEVSQELAPQDSFNPDYSISDAIDAGDLNFVHDAFEAYKSGQTVRIV